MPTPPLSGATTPSSAPTAAKPPLSIIIGTGQRRRHHPRWQRRQRHASAGPELCLDSSRTPSPTPQGIEATERWSAVPELPRIPLVPHRHRRHLSPRLPRRYPPATNSSTLPGWTKPPKNKSAASPNRGDPLSKEIFRVQAHALGLFFDEMINTFEPRRPDRWRRRARSQQRVPTMVYRRRFWRGQARSARGASRHSHPRHPQWRHRRRTRRRHRSPKTGTPERPDVGKSKMELYFAEESQ